MNFGKDFSLEIPKKKKLAKSQINFKERDLTEGLLKVIGAPRGNGLMAFLVQS